MRWQIWAIAVAGVLLLNSGSVEASELFIYPKNGQSADQQRTDESECKAWALDRSGFDPLETPQNPDAPQQHRGGAARGALAGAAVGAIAGNSDDAAKGAAIGGLLGGMRQSRGNRRQQASYEQQQAQVQQQQAQQRDDYLRAYSACLEARDYTVK